MKKQICQFFIFLLLPLIFFNCHKKPIENLKNNFIVIGITNEPENLNPLFPLSSISNDINSLLYNNLLTINDDLENYSPELAKSYEFNEDSLQVTFRLCTNIFWHDHYPFTAKDVVYTYNLQTNKRIAWDGISYKQNITDVRATNDSTVTFYFKKRTPFQIMNAIEGKILPKHILSKIPVDELFQSNFSHQPIGTGPYKLTEWKNQQYLILEKHDQYFKKSKPVIPKVIFKIVNDKSILFQQVLAGEVDIINDISPRNIQKINQSYPNLNVLEYPGKDYDFIGWNLIHTPSYDSLKTKIPQNPKHYIPKIKPHPLFGNKQIRKALSIAIDKEKICNNIFKNSASPIYEPYILLRNFSNKNHNGTAKFNLELAKKILADQGWMDSNNNGIIDKNGKEFIFTMYTNSGNPMREQLLMILEQEYKKLGIKMIPKIVEGNYLVSDIISTKNFDAVLLGWITSIKPDFTALFHSSQYLHPFHLTGYYSKEFDDLNQCNLSSETMEEYTLYLNKIVTLLAEDFPYTWLYYKKNSVLYNTRIVNFKSSIIDKYKYLEDFKLN